MDFDLMDKIRLAVVNGVWPVDDSSDDYYDDDDDDDAYSYDSSFCQHEKDCCRKSSQAYLESRMILMERSLEADRNAQALVDEEEKEKQKLEKKRAKKRRKRGRMKARKQAEQQQNDQEEPEEEENESSPVAAPAPEDTKKSKKKKSSKNVESTDNGEDILDINSAFVSAVCLKTGLTPKPVVSKENKSTSKKPTVAPTKPNEPTTRQKFLGEELASVGCQRASRGSYKEAVNYFSRAIEHLPEDHRFWGNRSFCYLQLGDYERALEDAERAITLSPDSSKAFYRKAEVLFALKDYAGAEESFERVLALDKDCIDAQTDLEQVRLARLMDMGFHKNASRMAIAEHTTVQAAVEALTNGNYNQYIDTNCDDINFLNNSETVQSYQEESSSNEASNFPRKQATINPSSSNKPASLWVGSVLSDVTEDILRNLFEKYGVVVSVRLLPEKSCAFVNFKESRSAGEAMEALQGYSLLGRHILIRYPNKTKEENHAYQQMVSNQSKIASTSNYAASGFAANGAFSGGESNSNAAPSFVANGSQANNFNRPKVKLKGPVNGQECYYWRTSGCAFGVGCRYKHIQENCGIDRKAWHK